MEELELTGVQRQSLGELATVIPVTGSFIDYASRFYDPALAFALGWAYWYLWLTVLTNEYNAISLVVMYWTDTVPQWAWIIIFWTIFLSFSMLGVLAYGEVEFWLSLIKVISISVFFILAIAISAGGIGPQKIGFKYWHDPGAFADSINGVARTFVIAGTLYAGTEMVGITAGESANPRRAVPRAINQVFWRILIFYVGMMFFIGILIPYTDSRLLGKGSKAAASPLTIALSDANIDPAAHLINALIVVSVLSAGNSSLYVASRTITHMARNGMAPKFLGKTDQRGVPWAALLFTNVFACIAFLSQSSSAGTLYNALITLSGVATFIVWGVIEFVHLRFRQALVAQGQSIHNLPFKALLHPYGTYACFAANIFLIFFQGKQNSCDPSAALAYGGSQDTPASSTPSPPRTSLSTISFFPSSLSSISRTSFGTRRRLYGRMRWIYGLGAVRTSERGRTLKEPRKAFGIGSGTLSWGSRGGGYWRSSCSTLNMAEPAANQARCRHTLRPPCATP